MASLSVMIGTIRSADTATRRVFDDALDIVRNTMQSAELTGIYHLTPKEKVRWRPKNGEKLCIRPSQGREVKIRVRPGNNDTCWDYALIGSNNVDMEAVRTKLETVLGPEVIEGSHEIVPPKPTTPLAVAAADPLVALEKMRQAIERRNSRLQERADLQSRVERIEKDIQKLIEDKETLTLEIMELDETNAKDPEAKAADELTKLLSGLGIK